MASRKYAILQPAIEMDNPPFERDSVTGFRDDRESIAPFRRKGRFSFGMKKSRDEAFLPGTNDAGQRLPDAHCRPVCLKR